MADGRGGTSVWGSVLDAIRESVPAQQYQLWFSDMRLTQVDDDLYHLTVPGPFHRDWIQSYYLPQILDAVYRVTGSRARVSVEVRDEPRPEPAPKRAQPDPSRPQRSQPGPTAPQASGPSTRRREARRAFKPATTELFGHPRYRNFLSDVILNDDYDFGSFVVGPSNQLAYAAAQAVASKDSAEGYNPLFLHGAVGLGKTHLLQAICTTVLSRNPDTHILYLSCESFVNQFIAAVAEGALQDFRYRYRHVDVLVIDDIHFLARKERTQEEFFHTFNTLYNSRKQIILSSDSPPREIPTIEERLVSRFKWGFVSEIEEPDHETRVSIVRKKAARRGAALSDEVAQLIAEAVTTNVRELEGAVMKVCGFSSLTGRPISLDLAHEALRTFMKRRDRQVSVETIQRAVGEHYGLKTIDLMGRKRHKSISLPRQVAMYLARQLTEHSLVEIGGHFGGRDHTTVIYACDKIAELLETTQRLKEDVDAVVKQIRAGR